jgi:hypothetical protein
VEVRRAEPALFFVSITKRRMVCERLLARLNTVAAM